MRVRIKTVIDNYNFVIPDDSLLSIEFKRGVYDKTYYAMFQRTWGMFRYRVGEGTPDLHNTTVDHEGEME